MTFEPTPGPWRWQFNRQNKSIMLVGGRPAFDKTVMQFTRWGMSCATPMFNEAIAGDRYNIMTRVCDRPDWVAPFPGRDHHASWCAAVVHPDARLIEAAPLMLAALRRAALALKFAAEASPAMQDDYNAVTAAIGAATSRLADYSPSR